MVKNSHKKLVKTGKPAKFSSAKVNSIKVNSAQAKSSKPLHKEALQVSYIKSAVLPEDYPIHRMNEVTFVGRSNAGKSSLINEIAGGKKIAKVSQTPGKTRLLNFFNVREKYVLVDMPGYGFAARGGDEMSDWQPMIEGYIMEREALKGVVLVMDVRRAWSRDEMMISHFAQEYGRPVALALTKSDKVSKNDLVKLVEKTKKDSRLSHVFVISNTKKTGYKELEEFIYQEWIKPS